MMIKVINSVIDRPILVTEVKQLQTDGSRSSGRCGGKSIPRQSAADEAAEIWAIWQGTKPALGREPSPS